MIKNISIKYKLILVNLCLITIPVLLISFLCLKQFKAVTENTISEAYNDHEKLGNANIKMKLHADSIKIQSLIDLTTSTSKKLAASSNMNLFIGSEDNTKNKEAINARNHVLMLLKTIKLYKKLVQERINTSLAFAEYIMKNIGIPEIDKENIIKWTAINQYTKQEKEITIPKFFLGSNLITKQFTFDHESIVVDKVRQSANVNCTILQRINVNGDMLRICTNVNNIDATRAVGTYIPAINPDGTPNQVISTIIKGEIFRGKAYDVNSWCITAYKPVEDNLGNIIGAIYVGVPEENEYILNSVLNYNQKKNMDVFLVNGSGEIQVHQKSKLIGKHIINDLNIKAFKKVLINKEGNKVQFIKYKFENNEIHTYYIFVKELDSFICVSISNNDFFKKILKDKLNTLKNEFLSTCLTSINDTSNINKTIFDQIRYVDETGKEIIALQSGQFKEELYNIGDTSWFKESLLYFKHKINQNNSYNAGMSISKKTNKVTIRIITPVFFNNAIKGFVIINLDWNYASELLKNNDEGYLGQTFIVNDQGIVISHNKYTYEDSINFTDSKYGQLALIMENYMLNGKEGNEKYKYNNVENILYYTPLKICDKFYSIGIITPLNEFFSMADKISKNAGKNYSKTASIIIIAIVITITISVLTAFIITQRISKPLIDVLNLAQDFSNDHISEKQIIKNRDDTGQVINYLNIKNGEEQKIIKLSNLKNIPIPVMEIDKDYNLIYVNDAYCHEFDISSEMCLGKKCYDFFNSSKCQTNECISFKEMKEEKTIQVETSEDFGTRIKIPFWCTSIPIQHKGVVTGYLNFMVNQTQINNFINEIKDIIRDIGISSEQLLSLSNETISSAGDVAELSEKSSINVKKLLISGNEILQNVKNKNQEIEEMSRSFAEISKFSSKAKEISLNAKEKSQEINVKMKTMASASDEIGKTILVIDEIADRTDLLALNAAIEAEGAGSAGKGFAVVADEVQKLARQSSEATNEITSQIDNVQKSTIDSQHAVKIINDTINEFSTINEKIAKAINKQNKTNKKILETTVNTTQKALSVSEDVSESYNIVKDIEIYSKESLENAKETNIEVLKISEMISSLKEIVKRFDIP